MLRNKNKIRVAALMLVLIFVLSAVACTGTKARTAVTPDKDPKIVVVDKSFTEDLLKEKGVEGGQIYVQNNTAVGVILAAKDADEAAVKAIATKYANEMKKTYKDMKVNFQIIKDGKNIVNINLD